MRNISADTILPGQIRICGDFVAGSRARGFLVITYGSNGAHYSVADHKTSAGSNGCVLLRDLSSGSYNYSVFTVNEKGLPISKSADKSRSFRVDDSVTSDRVTYEGVTSEGMFTVRFVFLAVMVRKRTLFCQNQTRVIVALGPPLSKAQVLAPLHKHVMKMPCTIMSAKM